MGVACPTCDDVFDSERGMKVHHSQAHNENIGKVSVICDNCGEEYEEYKSELKRTERNLCSRACFGEWQSDEQLEQNNPNWKGIKSEQTCEFCGMKYTNYDGREGRSRFCSKECKAKWQSENWTGEECPAWKGGHKKYYGDGWQKFRQLIYSKNNGVCQICGKSEEKNGRELSVHHYKRVSSFENIEDAHTEENATLLCRNCHQKVENLPVEEQKRLVRS